MKIYDNSNLAESYSGVTTPLTFSFARYVYQEVYKNFCQMMGVTKKKIKENSEMFPEMIVYIGGRMYYDLNNWYKMVSLLPGYSFNKNFFEEMLGVDKKADFKKDAPKTVFERWLLYFPKTLLQTLKIIFSFMFMGVFVRNFNYKFDKVYKYYNSKNLSLESEESIKNIFWLLTKKLVVQWKIPIANDFAVMISTGIVRRLFEKWIPDQNSYAFLYVGSSIPLISLDPGLLIMDIVEKIKNNEGFLTIFKSNSSEEILSILKGRHREHVISKKIFNYISKYGDRMPGELKLESKCLNEYPEIFIGIIINALKNGQSFSYRNIQRVDAKNCKIGVLKYLILSFFLNWAKKSIRMREETRFKRTLIFGFARKIFLELGRRYSESNKINDKDDIFYLTLEEILEESPPSFQTKKTLIQERQILLTKWRNVEFPRRIETELSISDLEKLYLSETVKQRPRMPLRGVVASKGGQDKLSCQALVMKEFDPRADFNNKIIITMHTDPGWSMIFPLIKGLVVERGGMLSHAAIVAREFNIPCIVGVENATSIVDIGEIIELNLNSGEIIKK